MRFWWVNHKKTFKKEIEGGYIWSPKSEKDGARNQTYINLTETSPNDIVFSYASGKMRAIGIVAGKCQESERPTAFGKTGEQWDSSGWLVQVNWSVLDNPITPKMHVLYIAPLLPQRHSPIRTNGDGNQKCYVAEISSGLASVLLKLIEAENIAVSDILIDVRDSIIEEEEKGRIEKASIPETEKEQLIKARRGQGLFRIRLEKIENACRLTGLRDKQLLIASHIKPWRKSNDIEKLDGNNGLLLSPHVDKLFDRGWISFSDKGEVLCANGNIRRIMMLWGLDPDKNIGKFNMKQKKYLSFHRKHIYKGQPSN